MLEQKVDVITHKERDTFVVGAKSFIDHPVKESKGLRIAYGGDDRCIVKMDSGRSLFWSGDLISEIEIIFAVVRYDISGFTLVVRLVDIVGMDVVEAVEEHGWVKS